jgi:hypothetical protein
VAVEDLVFGQFPTGCMMAVFALDCLQGADHVAQRIVEEAACRLSQTVGTGPHEAASTDRPGGTSGTYDPSAMGAKESDSEGVNGRVGAWVTDACETGVARRRTGEAISFPVPACRTSSGGEGACGVRRVGEVAWGDRVAGKDQERMAVVRTEVGGAVVTWDDHPQEAFHSPILFLVQSEPFPVQSLSRP